MMKNRRIPSSASKVTIAGFVAAAAGVTLQIISGASYPAVPPVFFILLVPAGLMAFGPWRWTAITAVVAGLFLTLGLFSSGAYHRLFNPGNVGDSIGLWIQALAVGVALISGTMATIQHYERQP